MVSWLDVLSAGSTGLFWQSNRVIALRMNKFAAEGMGASTEARDMIAEKMEAFSSAAMKLATGTFPHVVMSDLREVVDANVRRLTAESGDSKLPEARIPLPHIE